MLRAFDFKKDMKIIDFGCGSGALGIVLKPEGFTNIDGCDASQGLLDSCAKLGCYNNLKKYFVGVDDFPAEYEGAYDMCVTIGCLLVSHFPAEVFDLMCKSVKPGSLIFFSMRDFYWNDDNEMKYKVKVEELVKEKKLQFVKRLMFTKYEGMKGDEGKGFGVF